MRYNLRIYINKSRDVLWINDTMTGYRTEYYEFRYINALFCEDVVCLWAIDTQLGIVVAEANNIGELKSMVPFLFI